MANISGFGLSITVIATSSFPIGFQLTQFADDTDPIEIAQVTTGNTTMGLNGDIIFASNAEPIVATLSIIPSTDDDLAMQTLFNAGRVGKGKAIIRDVITIVASYPDGSVKTLTNGHMTGFKPSGSVASAGRLKTNTYELAFENIVTVPAVVGNLF